jgi:predicted porin
MADGATLYGAIDQAYSSSKTTDAGMFLSSKGNTKATNFSAIANGDTLIGVKGDEDLGGGLTAVYQIEAGMSVDGSASPTNRESWGGLTGGFGTVKLGTQYGPNFNNIVSVDPHGLSGVTSLGGNFSTSVITNNRNNSLTYALPSISGVNVSVMKAYGETAQVTNASSSALNNTTNTGDMTGYNLNYATGPVYVGFSSETTVNSALTWAGYSVVAASATNNTKNAATVLSYDLGVAKVSYVNNKNTQGVNTLKGSTVGISAPMGALTLGLTTSNGKFDTTGTTNDADLKGTAISAYYALSKRTQFYAQNSTATVSNAGVQGFKVAATVAGILIKF